MKILRDNNPKKPKFLGKDIRCPHCNSHLRFERGDFFISASHGYYVGCPACGVGIEFTEKDVFESNIP